MNYRSYLFEAIRFGMQYVFTLPYISYTNVWGEQVGVFHNETTCGVVIPDCYLYRPILFTRKEP